MQGEGFLYKQPLCPTPEVAALQHQAWDSCINSPLCATTETMGWGAGWEAFPPQAVLVCGGVIACLWGPYCVPQCVLSFILLFIHSVMLKR